jgi:hypothetical protein
MIRAVRTTGSMFIAAIFHPSGQMMTTTNQP